MNKPEIYISIDVETDGPIPGRFSMLSLGAAAFMVGREGCLNSWYGNLKRLPGAGEDPDTMNWWKTQPNAWAACHENQLDPADAMRSFISWVEATAHLGKATPVCVAYPAGFDFTFVYWYIRAFDLKSPFSFSCIDMKTYAMAVLNTGYRRATKKHMPKHWFTDLPHTHLAVDDAIEQGHLFMNMLAGRDVMDPLEGPQI